MSYRGGKIPRGDKQMRKLLSDLDEIAVRGSDTPRKPSSNAGTTTTPASAQPAQPSVLYNEDNSAGTISTIPKAPAGTLRITHYPGRPTFKSGGNLDLAGPEFTPDPNGVVAWMSDGNRWRELSRGAGAETFVPVRRYGALPNIASDVTSRVQAAFDNAPAGSVLVFEPGTYQITQATLRRPMSLCIPTGCTITSTGSTKAAIDVQGAVTTASATSLVTNPTDVVLPAGADDPVYPRGGDWVIYVTPGAEAGFPAGTWIRIEDDEVPSVGLPPDTELEFWYHSELVKVKSTASGIIRLESPLINTYVRVGTTDPRIRVVTPIEGVRIWGGGTISNPQAGPGQSHGIRLFYAVDTHIDGIRFNQCFDSCVHATNSREVIITNCEFQNAVQFDSKGYGFSCHSGQRITIANNTFKRLRHCIDFATFSRLCAATGNQCIGSTTGNINTHPSVEGVTITANLIDGGLGQDASAPSFGYGDSNVQASGINIDTKNKNISIIGNTIRNMRLSGIYIDTGNDPALSHNSPWPTEFVTISGNTIENCMLYRRVSPGSITVHAGIAVQENGKGGVDRRGIVITNNVLREPGPYGILVGISNTLVANNWIYKAEDKMIATVAPAVGIGIWIKPSDTDIPRNITVRDNIVTSCKQNGIRAGVNAGTAIAVPVIESNYCSENGGDGIFLEEICTSPMINYNICWSNGADGINNQSPGGFIVGNRLSSNTSSGIRLIAGADNNLVKDNIFEGAGTKITDLAASTFYMYIDDANDRYGIGTKSPQQRLQVNADGLRLAFSDTANDYTDLHHIDRTDFFGGLTLQPAVNSSALRNITLFGPAESSGWWLLDDGTDFWSRTSKTGYGFQWNLPNGISYRFNSNFDLVFQLTGPRGVTGAANIFVPSVYKLDDPSTNTVLQPITVQRNVSGGNGANGIGARISWAAENTAGTLITMSDWEAVFDVATSGSEDSSVRITIKDAAVSKEVFRIEGATPRLNLHNNASGSPQITLNCSDGAAVFNEQGNSVDFRVEASGQANMLLVDGTNARVGIGLSGPTQKLEVAGNARADMMLVDSDPGGVASTIGIVNAIAAVSGATPATIGNTGGGPAAAAQSHWLKIYDGTTARFIPVWT